MNMKVRKPQSLTGLSYLHFCNVLRIWKSLDHPYTYRVYWLYDNRLILGRITDEESLFFRPGRRKRQSGQPDAEFVPTFFDELTNITEAQKIICEDNRQCLFDLAVTGDMNFALNTLNHEKDTNATRETLGLSNWFIL